MVHLVPHTHWDREWYLPFQSFRLKLVRLVDRLLELMESDERYRFTLDGQLATLDDYLEVRPENEERVRRLVEDGRLAIGPWLVLMDEFLVSGETTIRNLEYGQRRAEEFGGAMAVGYLPDMFGHVAQMPQLLRLGGIDNAVVWRGVPAAIEHHEFEWEAPDGSVVRAEYMPQGYGNGAYLLDIPGRVEDRVDRLRESLRPFFGDDPLLAMLGTDHMEPPTGATELVDGQTEIRLSTLADYFADGPRNGAPSRWQGELRSSARANMLMGTLSARLDLKAAIARAERALARYAEPFQALYGGGWPERLLDLAWRRVIECSAHDSICGCSVDEVSAQVLVRCAEAEQIGIGLAEEAVRREAARAPAGAYAVFNPSPVERDGIVELTLPVPDDWEAVVLEPGRFATQEVSRNEPLVHRERVRGADVPEWLGRRIYGRELFGRRLNALVLGDRSATFEVDDEDDDPWLDVEDLKRELEAVTADDAADWDVTIRARPRRTVVAQVTAPPLGWVALRPARGAAEPPDRVDVGERRLANGRVSIEVAADGTFALNGIPGAGRLVDGRDEGDSYNYAPPVNDVIVDEPEETHVRVLAPGPVQGALEIVRRYRWGAGKTPVEVATTLELRAGEPFVRVRIAFDNPCDDHRLRFHVPLAARTEHSFAEGQFAVVERGLTAESGFGEVALPTFPAYGFVSAGGVAALLEHAMEYELVDGRELALTVLRSTGLISRNTNRYREAPAGPQIAIPDAQCRGPWEIGFGLLPHPGAWHENGVPAQLERYLHPFLVAPGRADGGPEAVSGPALRGDGVVLSSLRRREGRLTATLACEHPEAVQASFGQAEIGLGPWEIRDVELGD